MGQAFGRGAKCIIRSEMLTALDRPGPKESHGTLGRGTDGGTVLPDTGQGAKFRDDKTKLILRLSGEVKNLRYAIQD